jgi:hypothetical protein
MQVRAKSTFGLRRTPLAPLAARSQLSVHAWPLSGRAVVTVVGRFGDLAFRTDTATCAL